MIVALSIEGVLGISGVFFGASRGSLWVLSGAPWGLPSKGAPLGTCGESRGRLEHDGSAELSRSGSVGTSWGGLDGSWGLV